MMRWYWQKDWMVEYSMDSIWVWNPAHSVCISLIPFLSSLLSSTHSSSAFFHNLFEIPNSWTIDLQETATVSGSDSSGLYSVFADYFLPCLGVFYIVSIQINLICWAYILSAMYLIPFVLPTLLFFCCSGSRFLFICLRLISSQSYLFPHHRKPTKQTWTNCTIVFWIHFWCSWWLWELHPSQRCHGRERLFIWWEDPPSCWGICMLIILLSLCSCFLLYSSFMHNFASKHY